MHRSYRMENKIQKIQTSHGAKEMVCSSINSVDTEASLSLLNFCNTYDIYVTLHWTPIADGHLGRPQMANGGLLRPVIQGSHRYWKT